MSQDRTWMPLSEVYGQYGYKNMESARNAVSAGRFPVPTFKLAGLIAIDKEVHAEFFEAHRRAGLRALRDNKMQSEQQGGDHES